MFDKFPTKPREETTLVVDCRAETASAQREVLATVSSDGTVTWIPHQIFRCAARPNRVTFITNAQSQQRKLSERAFDFLKNRTKLAIVLIRLAPFAEAARMSQINFDSRSSCSIDVTNFPFDRQSCNLYFGSWTHRFVGCEAIMKSSCSVAQANPP